MSQDHVLPASQCLVDRRYADKTACLRDLAARAASTVGLDRTEILEALLRREALGSTGVGDGVALPHARLSSITHPLIILARLKKPIGFDAVDDRPVDVVCLLMLPAEPSGRDLSLLARCARALRNKDTISAIRVAPNPELLMSAMKLDDVEAGASSNVQPR